MGGARIAESNCADLPRRALLVRKFTFSRPHLSQRCRRKVMVGTQRGQERGLLSAVNPTDHKTAYDVSVWHYAGEPV